jgi:catechol 2,3-dioxygenase-like lactoylglutathione lyase family enzyme
MPGPLHDAVLGEVIVYVDDLAAMTRYYRDTLGLKVVRENAALVTLVAGGGAEIVLHQGRPAAACDETHGFVQFLVPDIDASASALGATVEERPYGRYARVRDPEGNLIGLEQARP